MLLKGYQKRLAWSQCYTKEVFLQCLADLDEDIEEVLPYLNALLGGDQYIQEPPSVTFRTNGRVIVIYPRRIAINKVDDESDADQLLEWLRARINDAWEHRREIEPRFEAMPRPSVIQILKILDQSSCRECDQASCVSFAVDLAEGRKGLDDCPSLPDEKKITLKGYLSSHSIRRVDKDGLQV